MPLTDLEQLTINTIRAVSADQPQAASSGHPGAPMGCAPMAYLLWAEIMQYSAADPAWINRDRFVLSNGHACALQYTMLHLTGYDVSADDLSKFRQINSKVSDDACMHDMMMRRTKEREKREKQEKPLDAKAREN